MLELQMNLHRAHHIAQLKKKALENEIIQEAQKVFNGKIIDVKIQKNPGDKT